MLAPQDSCHVYFREQRLRNVFLSHLTSENALWLLSPFEVLLGLLCVYLRA